MAQNMTPCFVAKLLNQRARLACTVSLHLPTISRRRGSAVWDSPVDFDIALCFLIGLCFLSLCVASVRDGKGVKRSL